MSRRPIDIEVPLHKHLSAFSSPSNSCRDLSQCMIANDFQFIFIVNENGGSVLGASTETIARYSTKKLTGGREFGDSS